MKKTITAGALLTAMLVLTACTDTPDTPNALAPSTAASVAPAPAASDTSCEPRRSLAPTTLPAPGSMPAGSYMAAIKKRGRLVVQTSQDTLLFGSRNPFTGEIEGFDVDVLREVARAIFGDPDKIQIVVGSSAERIPNVKGADDQGKDAKVDIVGQTMTINCARYKEVDFSSVYYDAGQKILAAKGSKVRTLADLAGKRVCAASGSTSIANIAAAKTPVAVEATTWADCLVLFQQGKVDAVSTDDTILAGLAVQDPYAQVVGEKFTSEPYGLAISKAHPEFTRFVNAVLAQMRSDGTWTRLYDKWLSSLGKAPAPPRAEYR